MSKLFPVQIYPSQLQEFKEKTNNLAKEISEYLNQKKLSAFKRNDYISIGLGYKSYVDLIDSANSRKQADKGQPLLLFTVTQICDSISQVLCSKVKDLDNEGCSLILRRLGQKESIDHKNTLKSMNNTPFRLGKPMRDTTVSLTKVSDKRIVDELQRMIKRHNVIILSGPPGTGKSLALSKVVNNEFVIDRTAYKSSGHDLNLIKSELEIPVKASNNIFAIDEAQRMPNHELIALTELAFKTIATLIIVSQIK
ncbi:MAG: ATP-binding protein [Colwellia sp.]|nr:ATP-binding protein [Colwellia sp.]